MRTRAQARIVVGIILIAMVLSLFPGGAVQAEKELKEQPISVSQQIADSIPQLPFSADVKITCTGEFVPEVDKPGSVEGDGNGHEGLDLCAAGGTPVHPVLPGEVVYIGTWTSWPGTWWGDSVIIKSSWQGGVVYFIYTHLDSTKFGEITIGQWIQQGQTLGYVSPIKGDSDYWSGPHLHLGLFKPGNDPVAIDKKTGVIHPVRDAYDQAEVGEYMLIWDNPRMILGTNPPTATTVASSPLTDWPADVALPTTPVSGQELEDWFWGLYTEMYRYVVGQRVVVINPPPATATSVPAMPSPQGEVTVGTPVVMSISAQSRDLTYQENIRRFFGGVSAGKDLTVLYQMDTRNFSGSWVIPPDQTLSVNDEFGWADYEEGQGMGIPAGMKIGDGDCNAASAVRAALLRAGIEAVADKPYHPTVPGVDSTEVATVCITTPAYPCGQDLDVHVTNRLGYPVRLNWKIDGDTLTLWVTRVETTSISPLPDDELQRLPAMPAPNGSLVGLAVFGVIAVLVIFVFWLRPGLVGSAMIWTVKTGPVWWRLLAESFKKASRWWLMIMALTVVLTPELAHIAMYGFGQWVNGETTISNMTIVVILVFSWANLLLNRWFYVKETKDMGGYWIITKKKLGCFGQIVHITVAVALVIGLFLSLGASSLRGATLPNKPRAVSNGACNGELMAELIKGSAYENSMPPSDKQAAIDALVGYITPELEEVYAEAEAQTGVPCEVIAGIHMVEATSRFRSGEAINYSVISGRRIGDPEPDQGGAVYASLLESAIAGAELLRDSKADGSIDSVEELIGALSLYNGGGNRNCRDYAYAIPYGGCPRLFVGEDDPYATSWLDAKHSNMYLLYCADGVACVPQDFNRAGSFTLALWFYSQVTSQR